MKEQPEKYAIGFVALYDRLIKLKEEEQDAGLEEMRQKRASAVLRHPSLLQQKAQTSVTKEFTDQMFRLLKFMARAKALVFLANIWYNWNSWIQWAHDNSSWSILSIGDTLVIMLFLAVSSVVHGNPLTMCSKFSTWRQC